MNRRGFTQRHKAAGFTVLELAIVIAFIGILAVFCISGYSYYKNVMVVGDEVSGNLTTVQHAIELFYQTTQRLPTAGELQVRLAPYCRNHDLELLRNPYDRSSDSHLDVHIASYEGEPIVLTASQEADRVFDGVSPQATAIDPLTAKLTPKQISAGDLCYFTNGGGYRLWIYNKKGQPVFIQTELVPEYAPIPYERPLPYYDPNEAPL